jgi:hypothetical protein
MKSDYHCQLAHFLHRKGRQTHSFRNLILLGPYVGACENASLQCIDLPPSWKVYSKRVVDELPTIESVMARVSQCIPNWRNKDDYP